MRLASMTINGAVWAWAFEPDGYPAALGPIGVSYDPQVATIAAVTVGNVVDTWERNVFGEPVRVATTIAGAPFREVVYERDGLGRIAAWTETLGSIGPESVRRTASYDDADRVLSVDVEGGVLGDETFSWDDNGARLSRVGDDGLTAALYDEQDRVTNAGGTAFIYDRNGDRRASIAGGTTTTRFDSSGALVEVATPTTTISYDNDVDGARVLRRKDGIVTHRFAALDGVVQAELDASGLVITQFLRATPGGAPDVMIRGTQTLRFIKDHVGSPRFVVDVDTGAVLQEMQHDTFGRVVVDTSPGFQPFGFGGGLYDPDTGLVRLGAREYDPATACFLSRDPLGFSSGTFNHYAYAAGDPINLADPTGLGPQRTPLSTAEAIQIARKFEKAFPHEQDTRWKPDDIVTAVAGRQLTYAEKSIVDHAITTMDTVHSSKGPVDYVANVFGGVFIAPGYDVLKAVAQNSDAANAAAGKVKGLTDTGSFQDPATSKPSVQSMVAMVAGTLDAIIPTSGEGVAEAYDLLAAVGGFVAGAARGRPPGPVWTPPSNVNAPPAKVVGTVRR